MHKKFKNFEEFPNPLRQSLIELSQAMKNVREQIQRLSHKLDNSRNDYKQAIFDFFNQNSPFPTEGEIDDDLDLYMNLVSYCLDAGDPEILDKWGIADVYQNPIEMLASTNYELYLYTFQEARKEAETALEETCWEKLIHMFYSLSNPQEAHELEQSS
jgi:hypothetical protein